MIDYPDGGILKGELKILFLGDVGVGKTCLLRRYISNIYVREYKGTIGIDYVQKVIELGDNGKIKLKFWDICGNERFGNNTHSYYRDADAAMIGFDLTRPNTLDSVISWKMDLDSKVRLADASGSVLPVALIGNKTDVAKVALPPEKMDEFCRTNGFGKWFFTSAKNNENVDDAFLYMAMQAWEIKKDYLDKQRIVKVDDEAETEPPPRTKEYIKKKNKKECCCVIL